SRSCKRCTLLSERTGTLELGPEAKGAVVHPNAQGQGYYRFAVDAATYGSATSTSPRATAAAGSRAAWCAPSSTTSASRPSGAGAWGGGAGGRATPTPSTGRSGSRR